MTAIGEAPVFERSIRTNAERANAVSLHRDELPFATGYWGIQRLQLN